MCDVLTFNPYIHYEMTRVKLFNLSVPQFPSSVNIEGIFLRVSREKLYEKNTLQTIKGLSNVMFSVYGFIFLFTMSP